MKGGDFFVLKEGRES
jgi:hypothetical protein